MLKNQGKNVSGCTTISCKIFLWCLDNWTFTKLKKKCKKNLIFYVTKCMNFSGGFSLKSFGRTIFGFFDISNFLSIYFLKWPKFCQHGERSVLQISKEAQKGCRKLDFLYIWFFCILSFLHYSFIFWFFTFYFFVF